MIDACVFYVVDGTILSFTHTSCLRSILTCTQWGSFPKILFVVCLRFDNFGVELLFKSGILHSRDEFRHVGLFAVCLGKKRDHGMSIQNIDTLRPK